MPNTFAAYEAKQDLKPHNYDFTELKPFHIEVEITHCGICHSDLHLIDNDWGISNYPIVPGHEIVGTVTKKHDAVENLEVGSRVGIGWQNGACLTCEPCKDDEPNLCAKQTATCVDQFGGFANQIQVDSRFAIVIPEKISSEHAAPLMCGGGTVFSALKEYNIYKQHKIAIIGLGGLGHLAVQYAKALGAEVYVISHSKYKTEDAKKLGATGYINLSDKQDFAQYAGYFDHIFCTAPTQLNYFDLFKMLGIRGTFVLIGVPKGGINIHPFILLDGRKKLSANNIASPKILAQMLDFSAQHNIVPWIKLYPLEQVNQALNDLRNNNIHYRAVLTV